MPFSINITFIDRDGDKKTVPANKGDTLLDVAKDNDIDLEGWLFYSGHQEFIDKFDKILGGNP